MGHRITGRAALLLALCVAPGACAAATPTPSPAGAIAYLPAIDGDYFPLQSVATGRTFHIHVRLPEGYDRSDGRRYPVVYVLDGDSLFPLLAASHLFIALDDRLPEAIVVGIAYGGFDKRVNKRDIDFRPPGPGASDAKAGAQEFARFLRNELLPRIEARYATDPARRILFGQSLGGGFVLYSAFAEPDLFWGRIASNPSISSGRDYLYGTPARGARRDLSLIVASGTADRPNSRTDILNWLRAWEERENTPWTVERVTVEDGTHAANSIDAYRAGLRLLFREERD